MKNLLRLFMKDENILRIQRTETGDSWMVKKGFSVLYIGSKEKCQIYMSQGQAA